MSEPTWKKRGCGTSILAALAVVAAVLAGRSWR